MTDRVEQPRSAAARPTVVDALLALVLFGLLWLPRGIALDSFVTIDEPVWLAHATTFAYGLVQHDWALTFRLEHPGVTTMWLGVAGLFSSLPDYTQRVLADPETYRQPFEQWLGAQTTLTPLALLRASRWWVTLAVAFTLTLSYFPLRRLVGRWVAFMALLFIAWSPMAVAFSRQLQPDGLLAALTLGALTYFLVWLYAGRHWQDLIIAGVLMGLAWLTKIPAAMLAPTGALLIGTMLWQARQRKATFNDVTDTESDHAFSRLLLGYVLWGVVATLVFFALWPTLWVDPVGSFRQIYTIMSEYAGGHANPNFYLGQVTDDPGLSFYPVAYLLRTTPAELIGLVVALLAWWQQRALFANRRVRQSAFGLLIFALVFTVVMSVIGKKFDRYLLPAFLALTVLSALGWMVVQQVVKQACVRRLGRGWAVVGSGLVLVVALGVLHGFFTVQSYPYYMTYYNPLLGGARTAEELLFVGWGEGLEEVGAWLNQQPEAEKRKVIAWYATGPLSYFFKGNAINVLYGSRMPWLDADYVVLYINQIQRGIPTWAAVDYFLQQPPVYTVTSQNLTLARLYDLHAIVDRLKADMAAPVPQPVTVTWPDLELRTLQSLTTTTIASALPIQMSWRGRTDGSYKVSLRLISEQGDLVAQQDTMVSESVTVQLFVPPDAAPGAYTLFLLVYVDETLEPVRTADGIEAAPLLPVQITESRQ